MGEPNNLSFSTSKSLSSLFAKIIIAALVLHVFINHAWSHRDVISSDIFSYYAYLPSFFIKNDVTLSFLDYDRHTPFNNLWYSTSDLGIRFTKMPMGWSILNAPFFLIAHVCAKIFNFLPDGFSKPYEIAICLSTLFYVCAAVVLLRKLLLNYFSETTVSLALVTIVFGTNLYHYTVFEPGMTHPLSFFLFACFLWLTVEWHRKANFRNSLLLGLLIGLITITRATNILVVLVFIFYNVNGWKSLKEKFQLIRSHYKFLMLVPLAALLVFAPQFVYWKMVSGHFVFYSYTDEHFFLRHPNIADGLFGFRKGWLLYTPVMGFALLGLFLHRKTKEWMVGFRLFAIFNTCIILSWWCWWYGGGFGGRSFIESSALLSIPLSAFFNYASCKRPAFTVTLTATIFLIFLNVYQTFQYKHGLIHYDSMTKESYKAVFLKGSKPDNFSSLICHPDYFNAKLGIPERGDCVLHDHVNP